VTIGAFATATVPGLFSLAYLVFNTIMNLTSQDKQVACFQNVAAHLEPGGCFVIEVGVPDLQRLPHGNAAPASREPDAPQLRRVRGRLPTTRLHHYRLDGSTSELRSIPFRYVWPSELDLMARPAGTQPRERWGRWKREPFGPDSTRHVSLWEKRQPRRRITR
jgi:hypothetical protein